MTVKNTSILYTKESIHKEKKVYLYNKIGRKPTAKQVILLIDILKTYECSIDEAYLKFVGYYAATSKYQKTLLRFGQDRADLYKTNMLQRARPQAPVSVYQIDYWVDRHEMSEPDAKLKISELQKLNAEKRGPYLTHQNSGNLEYYTHRGFSVEDSVLEREKHLDEKCYMRNLNLLSDDEHIKFMQRYVDAKETKIRKYGTNVFGGIVSKESLLFFIKLYKLLRRKGISRDDIYWGIKGSKEFATKSEGLNYLYDFTIRSKRIIIEYNGTYWHPRSDISWRNSLYTYDVGIEKDQRKMSVANNIGFSVYYVWSDDDQESKIKQLMEIIFND